MDQTAPSLARRAALGAILAGIAADLLFDRVALGINVPIAVLTVLALVTGTSPRRRPADPLDLWLPAVAILASLGPALRTDATVAFLDVWLIVASVAAWSLAVAGVAVTRQSAAAAVALGVRAGVALALGLGWLLARAGADGFFSRGTRQLGRITPLVRGALVAVPVVVGFAFLLVSADAVFGRAVDELLRLPLDVDEVVGRSAFSIIAAVLVAGPVAIAAGLASSVAAATATFSAEAAGGDAAPSVTGSGGPAGGSDLAAQTRRRAGVTETLVVLLAVDVLFAAFAVVQVVYLFGGADTLAAIGMTYSDHARQGYFQLVGVVALAGLLVLGAHEVIGRTRTFIVAAMTLLGLTAIILASAALRLRLYQDAYGWTELRFFVAASIAWLAACVVIAALLLARNRMRWLPHGLAMSAVAVTLAVSALGPQAFVMRENLARVMDPGLVPPGGHSGFDAAYALTLGDDAIPALVAALDRLPADQRPIVIRELAFRRAALERDSGSKGWFAWNLARGQAREALARLPGG